MCSPRLVRAAPPSAGSASLGKSVPLWKLWCFCPGKMWRGAGWTALQSTDPLLSPGTPSSRTVQAWLDKIHKEGWGVHVCGVQVCGRPSQWTGLETVWSQQQLPGRSLAKALITLWSSAAPWSPAEMEPTWSWKTRHRHHCHLLGMQIQRMFIPKCTRGIFTDCKALFI